MEYPSYNPASDYLPLSDEELSMLDDMLSKLPSDAAMNIEALDGYLTALLLSPQPLAAQPGAAWLPEIWGGDGADGIAPFVSGKQKKRVMMLVLRHLHSIAVQLKNRPDAWEPIFSIAVDEEGAEMTDAEDWCIGFMLGVDLAADEWAARFEDETQGALLSPIALLGGDESQQDPQDLAQLANAQLKDALSREIPDAVLALAGHG
ncbi:YecA family protein [Mitsuaria sp. WAJ17]|uniref:UPF0149 family protein n=1 Tax=Mitsuaria sp. WAJ17 TaxID=2761452 RepID=UPI00160184D4|nr:UPF0149 family protein [Mitsuaria sp. WAJ17]MBB2485133.1 YecA family protein [Mitsuaria sp. WAJ17]